MQGTADAPRARFARALTPVDPRSDDPHGGADAGERIDDLRLGERESGAAVRRGLRGGHRPRVDLLAGPTLAAVSLHLFAGLRVRDFRAARPWYERLLGDPTFFPHAAEAVWTLDDNRSIYI